MTLKRVTDIGGVFEVLKVSFGLTYYPRLSLLQKDPRLPFLVAYMESRIEAKESFSVATEFPNPWPSEMDLIYETLQDEVISALFLGCLIQDLTIQSDTDWYCTATNIQGRDFSANFYWKGKSS